MPSRVQQAFAEDGASLDSALKGRAARFVGELEWSARALGPERERDTEPDGETYADAVSAVCY